MRVLTPRRITLAVLVAALSAPIAACHSAGAPVQPGLKPQALRARSLAADYYPLAVGAKWEYRLLQKQGDGPIGEKPMSIAITSVTPLPDGGVEAVTERRYQSWSPPPTRVRRHADRVVLSRLSDPIDGPSLTILKFPLDAHTAWPGRPFGGGNSETVVPFGEETVTVPAGTFKAFRVDHKIRYATGDTDDLNYWYAPGRGVVKMIERSTLFQGDTKIHLEVTGELTAYDPGR